MFLGSTVRGLPAVTLATAGAVTIDRSGGERFDLTPTGAVTLAVANDLDNDAFQVRVRGSAFAVTWFAGIKWPGGVAPTPLPKPPSLTFPRMTAIQPPTSPGARAVSQTPIPASPATPRLGIPRPGLPKKD